MAGITKATKLEAILPLSIRVGGQFGRSGLSVDTEVTKKSKDVQNWLEW